MRHRCIVGDVGRRGRRAFRLKVLFKLLWKCETIERKNYHHQLPCGFFFNIYTYIFFFILKIWICDVTELFVPIKVWNEIKDWSFFFVTAVSLKDEIRLDLFSRWNRCTCFSSISQSASSSPQPYCLPPVSSNQIPRHQLKAKRPLRGQKQYEHSGSVAAMSRLIPSNSLRSLSPFLICLFFKVYIYLNNFVFCFISLKTVELVPFTLQVWNSSKVFLPQSIYWITAANQCFYCTFKMSRMMSAVSIFA